MVDIDAGLTNVHKMTLTQDATINIINPPPTGKMEMLHIVIFQDGTGGHQITSWDPAINGTPSIDTAPNSVTVISLFTVDEGVTWFYVSTKQGIVGQDISKWATYPAVQNVDINDKDILGVKNLDFDDPLSKILGLQKIEYFQSGHTLESIAGELKHSVADDQKHTFYSGATEIAEFRKNSSEVFLDLVDNELRNVSRIRMPQNSVSTVTNIPEIHFDEVTDLSMVFNVPTNRGFKFKENGSTLLTIDETGVGGRITDLDVLEIGNQLKLLDAVADPVANGEFKRNGADVKVFTGGGVKNLSDIGGSDNLGNHTAEQDLDMAGFDIINSGNIKFNSTGFDIGDSVNYVDDIFLERVRFPANNAMVTNAFNIGRNTVNTVDSMILNVPTSRNIVLQENAVDQVIFDFVQNRMELQQDGGINQIRIVPSSGNLWAVSKSSGKAFYQSQDGHEFTGDVVFSSDALNELMTFQSIDATPDEFEMNISSNVDFELKAQSNSILFYDQSMNQVKHGQVSIFEKELNLKETSINPSTPSSGYIALYNYVNGATKELRIKDDGGSITTVVSY